jgi:geranylgeranyl diphosphate synthase type II
MIEPTDFLQATESARNQIDLRLRELIPESPKSIYDPVRYVLASGGKRIRPALTYLTSLAMPYADWLPAACAVELLHNFTLVHDDIMDHADTRRGRPTLHKQYDESTAILAGDTIIALAMESLASGSYELSVEMMREFSFGFKAVCEGQALDKEFELRNDVSVEEYLQMIDLKSAKMLELAAVLGDLAAGGRNVEAVREFTHHIGIAFQINDDLLDLTADEAGFGKKIGGDILEGKRTYLYLSALDRFSAFNSEAQEMLQRIQNRQANENDIVLAQKYFALHGITDNARMAIEEQTITANAILGDFPSEVVKKCLLEFSSFLLGREN